MTNPSPRPRCSHVPTCELFPRFGLKAALGVWKTYYCEGGFEQCARFKLALQSRPVPLNLLPNGKELDLALLGMAP